MLAWSYILQRPGISRSLFSHSMRHTALAVDSAEGVNGYAINWLYGITKAAFTFSTQNIALQNLTSLCWSWSKLRRRALPPHRASKLAQSRSSSFMCAAFSRGEVSFPSFLSLISRITSRRERTSQLAIHELILQAQASEQKACHFLVRTNGSRMIFPFVFLLSS